jgi:hypothetical protein
MSAVIVFTMMDSHTVLIGLSLRFLPQSFTGILMLVVVVFGNQGRRTLELPEGAVMVTVVLC